MIDIDLDLIIDAYKRGLEDGKKSTDRDFYMQQYQDNQPRYYPSFPTMDDGTGISPNRFVQFRCC